MDCNLTEEFENTTCIYVVKTKNIMSTVANSVLVVASIVAISNMIAIGILVQCKRMIYQIKLFAINLALTDCLTGFYSLLDAMMAKYGLNVKVEWCVIRCHIDIMLVLASIFFMTVFALDRFLSLKFAMQYHDLVSKRRVNLACVITWLLSLLVTVTTYIDGFKRTSPCICVDNRGYPMISLISRNACFLTIIFVYVYIFWQVRQQNRKIMAFSNMPGVNVKPALKISVIVAAVFFMYFPKNIFLLYCICRNELIQDNLRIYTSLIYIEKLNSMVNPLLYVWRFKECRMHVMKTFCWFHNRLMSTARKIDYELTGSYMINVEQEDNQKQGNTKAKEKLNINQFNQNEPPKIINSTFIHEQQHLRKSERLSEQSDINSILLKNKRKINNKNIACINNTNEPIYMTKTSEKVDLSKTNGQTDMYKATRQIDFNETTGQSYLMNNTNEYVDKNNKKENVDTNIFMKHIDKSNIKENVDINGINENSDIDSVNSHMGITDIKEHMDINGIKEHMGIKNIKEHMDINSIKEHDDINGIKELVDIHNTNEHADIDRVKEHMDIKDVTERMDIYGIKEHVDICNTNEHVYIYNTNEHMDIYNTNEHVDIYNTNEHADIDSVKEHIDIKDIKEHENIN